ncbi:hypothetical protein ACWD00_11450 [Streptomyces viridiviolaceus]
MSGPHDPAEPPSGTPEDASQPRDGVTELVRWAAFSCVLVPVVLLWYGASLAGATGTAFGLAAVTGVCRVLLRRSERLAAGPGAEPGALRRGRRHGAGPEARGGGRRTGENTPVG